MTRSVLNEVLEYLDACGVFVPDFRHAIHLRMSGSYVTETPTGCFLHLGCYATRFIAEWFVMHEVGHVLWHFYEPSRNHIFKRYFGAGRPENYDDVHRWHSWRGPLRAGLGVRLRGEPSEYGALGGGEERFCELLGFMYATGGFDKAPPKDLSAMWRACWQHGLSRMTHDKIRTA